MAIANIRVLFPLRSIPRILINVDRSARQLTYIPSRSAGHSHWQNIRHTKEAKDRERARVTSNFLLQIDAAIKLGGGERDPKHNGRLASVIADAKSKNVPMDTINRRLSAHDMVDPYIIEIQAPGGIFALIETRCKAVKPTRDKVQGIVKKYGFKVSRSTPGSIANEFFEHKGVISVAPQKTLENIDVATELAIDCGAHDVTETEIDAGVKGFEFHCGVNDVNNVRQSLESRGVNVYESFCPYLAVRKVSVSSSDYKLMNQMYDRIRDAIDYTDNFYDNCEETE
ncbi:translational activator of cytochrome c oxidase [Echinococcus multilocularis]|uniref:Translational activator of cytochrome c oxidase n=1 Tax=Echinococcus multilocularis TaxID=6211 RepID=A0A068Y4G6_ECHMU|nr:translational activator of cytochrome c oxidase [Echinococcus multilocularis]